MTRSFQGIPCGSEPARDRHVSVSSGVTDPAQSRAGSLPQEEPGLLANITKEREPNALRLFKRSDE